MQFKVHTTDFKEALSRILSVTDKKGARPILSYVLFEVTDQGLIQLSATDLEVSAKVIIEGNVENSGTFCVNAKNIFDIVKELPEANVLVKIENETSLKLDCDNIHYTLLIYKPEDFPHLVFGNKNNEFELDSKQLLNIINKTSHAISTDETRLYLNGIYLQEVDSKLRAVATDGHRLSLLETDLANVDNETLVNGIIIPKKGVFELKKIAENFPDNKIKISVDDSFMYINADNRYLMSIRLIAREYPKYQAVIPSKTSFTMRADKNSLHDAIKRIKIMSNEKSNGVKVHLNSKELTVTANHPSLGDATEKIAIDYNGKEMDIGFNAKYLIDALASFDEGDISLELNNELSPVVIKSANSPNYLGIIMPLKL